MPEDNKKKVAIAGVASILLVAAVVAVAIGNNKSSSTQPTAGSTTKTVQAMCAPTDYKDTCQNTLSQAKTSDPKEMIKEAFEATLKNIGDVLKNSATLKEAAADESTKDAFNVCQEVLETAVDDLRRSFDKVGEFDAAKTDEYVEELKTWLSAVITNQETCIDAFENTTGDNGEKMKSLLKTAKEMSSNGLAMVSDIQSILASLEIESVSHRRLLSSENGKADGQCMKRRLLAADEQKPNAVVAQDGSGQYKKISEAIAKVPKKNKEPFVIYVKAGVYKEYAAIPKGGHMVTLIGDGPTKTIITGNKNFAKGVKTYHTATFAVNADDFIAKDIAFENTAGPEGHQAVALRVSGDRAIFYNVKIDGYQDTLYDHTYRQYYRDCSISGTIDFIFGDSLSIFQNCTFIVRKPMKNQACMVTAQGRIDRRSIGAIVIQNGNITAEPEFVTADPPHKAYLGRPWKELSRTIIMQSDISASIVPEGWSPWAGTFALDTCYYAEYQNRGPGSSTADRVKWKGIKKISAKTAESFTGGKSFKGDEWVKNSGVPYVATMMSV